MTGLRKKKNSDINSSYDQPDYISAIENFEKLHGNSCDMGKIDVGFKSDEDVYSHKSFKQPRDKKAKKSQFKLKEKRKFHTEIRK